MPAATGSYPVYVYVAEEGYDTAGEKINGTGKWITIGKFKSVALDDPTSNTITKKTYYTSGSNWDAILKVVNSGFDGDNWSVYSEFKNTISLADVDWSEKGLKSDAGATDYSSEASTGTYVWHLDGAIVRGQVTINYYKSENGGSYKQVTADTKKVGVKVGNKVNPSDYINMYADDGYTLNSAKSSLDTITIEKTETGGAGKTYTIDLYYDKVTTTNYTVKYVDASGTVLKTAETKSGTVGSTVSEKASDAPTISGYAFDKDNSKLSITLGTDEGSNVITYVYNKKTDLSYNVEYYWGAEGSTEATKIEGAGSTVTGQIYGTTVSVTPTAPSGYTLRSTDAKSVYIDDATNTVKFYCYKNATLVGKSVEGVKYDGKDHEVSGYAVKDETGVTFEGITATTGTAVDAATYATTFSKSDGTEVVGTKDKTDMYVVTGTEAGGITISKRNIVLQSENLTKVYDGNPLNAGGEVAVVTTSPSDDTLVEGEKLAYTFSGSRTEEGVTNSGNVFTVDWNDSATTAKESNYNITAYKYGSLTVTKNNAEYVVYITQTGGTSKSYTGSEQSVDFGWEISSIYTPSNAPELTKSDVKFNGTAIDLALKGTDSGTYYSYEGKTSEETAAELAKLFSVDDSKLFPHVTYVVLPASLVIAPQTIDPSSEGYPTDEQGNPAGVTVEAPRDVTYSGKPQEQKPVVRDAEGNELVEGKDYELSYSEDTTNAGTATVTVTGKGNYSGTVKTSYQIKPREVTVKVDDAIRAYDGSALVATGTTVTSGSFVDGDEPGYSYNGSQTDAGTSASSATPTFKDEKTAANYKLTVVPGALTVTAQSIDPSSDAYPTDEKGNPAGVTVSDPEDVTYDGSEQKQPVTVRDAEGNELVEGKDYTVAYSEDATDAGEVGVTVTGIGNYSGTVTKTYQIKPYDVTVTAGDWTCAYDGKKHNVTGYSVSSLAPGHEVGGADMGDGKVGAGTYEVNIKDGSVKITDAEGNDVTENYNVTLKPGTLNITAQSIDPSSDAYPTDEKGDPAGVTVSDPEDVTYDGSEQKQPVTVRDTEGNELVEGKDYTVAYSEDATDAGEVSVTVTGIGNYSGTVTKTYQILPRKITVTVQDASKSYDGTILTSEKVVVSADGFLEYDDPSYTFEGSQLNVGSSEANATCSYAGNKNYDITVVPGTLIVTEQSLSPTDGEGNPSPDYKGVTVEAPADVTYNGEEQFQKPVVRDADGNVLEEGKDYELLYVCDNARDAGTVTVEVVGRGNYAGVASTTYEILPRKITVTVQDASKSYDGTVLTSEKVVVSGDGFLESDDPSYTFTGSQLNVGRSDAKATCSYAGNKNYDITLVPGTLTVTAQSIDPSSDAYPTDEKGNPAGVTADEPSDVTYDGKEHKYVPVVRDAAGNELVEGVDYDVTYDTDDFVNSGTIKVTISGKGNFSGTIVKTYKIKPAEETPAPAPVEPAEPAKPAKKQVTPKTGDTTSVAGILTTLSAGIAAFGTSLRGRRRKND